MGKLTIGLVRRGFAASGGAERYLARFAAALSERGHRAVLFASPEWPEPDSRFERIVRIPGDDPISFADRLAEARPREHCDLLYSFERVWDCDAYRAGDGVHRAWLDLRARSESPVRSWFRAVQGKHRQLLALEAALFSADSKPRIVANSERVKLEIQSYYGKPFERIRVIYNGYKPPAVAGNPRANIRHELGLSDQEVMLLFTGSGWERKGLEQAVRAAHLLRTENVRLVVAGRGKKRPARGAHVRYLGTVQDMPSLYEAADLFILPTLYDPFSNASLEAAAHGLPVITTTANGFSEVMIHGWCGEVVADPHNVPALADAVRSWLPAKKRQESRDRIRHWARDFRVGSNVEQTLDFLLS